MRWLMAAALGVPLFAAGSASELARGIRELSLDPEECYRVREVTLVKEDLRIYLTDGYLVFAKPVEGRRPAAIFTALETEGGDAEILLMPPLRGERKSLATYTGSPNMSERVATAVFIFSDDTYEEFAAQARANPFNRKSPEMGLLLADKYAGVVRNIATSFQTRLALDLLSGARPGFFAGAVGGRKLGNFDLLFDPRNREQIVVGNVGTSRDNRNYFDVWTSFEARSFRKSGREPAEEFKLADYRIEATVEPSLMLRVAGSVKLKPAQKLPVIALDISRDMRLFSAAVDGREVEVLQHESMRANLVRNTGNDLVLLVPAAPLEPGRDYEVAFKAEGKVIHEAGNQVYYVGSRGNWYPNRWMQFATFDLTFRYPQGFEIALPGQLVEDKTDGEWRLTRRRTPTLIRIAGFNLGHFERTQVSRAGYTVEVCANRKVEKALEPRPAQITIMPPPALSRGRRPETIVTQTIDIPAPDPRHRLQELASDVASALEYMHARFGPAVLKTLTVSPVPGTFGQGFSGLLYLSTLAYLGSQDRPVRALSPGLQLFFSEILQAHETAHQWWGNVVGSSGYHDDWLMEALANYSALLFLEKRKGTRTLETVLDEYRARLLAGTDSGENVDATGPIVLGSRLETSTAPEAWRHIIYGKGSWIMHMLRRRMGDERFLAMLAELRRRYEFKAISTEQFRQLGAKYMPPKADDGDLNGFFEQWVYGTGIPALKMTHTVKGKPGAYRVTGTITQSAVDENFSVIVPVEIQLGRTRLTQWVRTSNEPAQFNVTVRQAPVKVTLDPGLSVLRR